MNEPTPRRFELEVHPDRFAITRLGPESEIPAWAELARFVSITRTPIELSIVCPEGALPGPLPAQRGYRCLGVRGPLGFEEVGILASLTRTLAEVGISVFAISTYETDFLLVTDENLKNAIRHLRDAGHVVHTESSD